MTTGTVYPGIFSVNENNCDLSKRNLTSPNLWSLLICGKLAELSLNNMKMCQILIYLSFSQ